MKKGDLLEGLVVETMAAEGKCLARLEGKVVFLEGGAPGDTVTARVTKIKSAFLEAVVTEVTAFSPDRKEPFCQHFGLCGGCSWQHIDYSVQLYYKQKQVVDHLERIGKLELPEVKPILKSPTDRYYRNKLDFTFSAQRWVTKEEMLRRRDPEYVRPPDIPALGFHIPRKYDLAFHVDQCHLQPDPSNGIRTLVYQTAVEAGIPFFDLRKQIGFLRTLTIRSATTGEVMVILQVTYDKMEWIDLLLNAIQQQYPTVTSLMYVINGKKNDTFGDLTIQLWKGNDYITEKMQRPGTEGTLQFRIGPKSFYQTNPVQAEVLYRTAWEMAGLTGKEHVYDLYTGTGTIACYVAAQAKSVVGLEYVAAAIDDAKVNAELNGITNARFFAGDIKDLLTPEFLAAEGRPDVVITDPPRAGMHEDVTKMLLQAAPEKIVYVSCNAATQARDLAILDAAYRIEAVQPVDMFPQTMHVENVVLLRRDKVGGYHL